jgi:site-specific recombinase XerD
VQAFFTERLARQRRASGHTISAYRDTLRLLLNFAAGRTGTSPCRLDIADLNAPMIAAFLDHLEHDRANSVRTRNARLAAIHSLFTYAALRHPEHAADINRVLAIPPKRADQTIVTFLTDPKAQALLVAPDRATRTGRRDHTWILLAIQTGLRASELTSLTCADVHLGTGAYVACHGKGRKDRITPLAPDTVTTLRAWLTERAGTPEDPLFPSTRGGPMSNDALQQRLSTYATRARRTRPTLPARTSHLTSCATQPQCACSTPGSTSPSSPYGSVTKTSPPHRSTCKPTWPSSSKPSTAQPHQAPPPAATGHPISSSHSSKPCNYADITSPGTPTHQRSPAQHRHNRSIGVMHDAGLDNGLWPHGRDRLG